MRSRRETPRQSCAGLRQGTTDRRGEDLAEARIARGDLAATGRPATAPAVLGVPAPAGWAVAQAAARAGQAGGPGSRRASRSCPSCAQRHQALGAPRLHGHK